jgi:CDP-diacylglycerol--glycerol-3-phosphate 3-phosphatidyltransferase
MIDGRRGRPDAPSDEDEHELPEATDSDEQGDLLQVTPPGPDAETPVSGADHPGAGSGFLRTLKAIGPRLHAMGVKADHVTVLGMLLAGVTGVTIGLGYLYVAIVLLTVGGLMDTLDGAVAKAAGTTSKRGAFFDSVSDRVADMFIFGGLAWYFAAGPGHDPKMVLIPFAILGVSNTISYERAKAESLGYNAKGGLMERAERLIGLGVCLLLHVILVPLLAVLLALCVVTGWQRFFKVWRQASAPAEAEAGLAGASGLTATLRPRRPPRVESRWRAWRDASTAPERRRRRVTVASRARSRRRDEPLSLRLRQAFQPERSGTRPATRTATRAGRARAERRRQGAESSFRRRLGSGR